MHLRTTSLVVVSILSCAISARADKELTEDSPSVLGPHEVRIGVGQVGVGLWGSELLERFELDTHPLVYALDLTAIAAYDVAAKFKFWDDRTFAMSVGAGITNVDLSPLFTNGDGSHPTLRIRVVPLEANAGVRLHERVRLTGGLVYTDVSLRGGMMAGPIDQLDGAIGTSNLQARVAAEVRLSPHWFVIGGARMLGWEKGYVQASAQSGNTDGMASAETTMLGFGDAWAASVAFHLQLDHFNLRLGAAYGNYQIPVLNLVVPSRGVMPVFEMFWRI